MFIQSLDRQTDRHTVAGSTYKNVVLVEFSAQENTIWNATPEQTKNVKMFDLDKSLNCLPAALSKGTGFIIVRNCKVYKNLVAKSEQS